MNKIQRLAIADDHKLFLQTTARILSTWERIELVATATHVEQVKQVIAQHRVDILMTDLKMPSMAGGLSLIRWVREHHPSVKIMVVSMDANPQSIRAAFEHGVNGYVCKDDDIVELERVFWLVVAGGRHLSHKAVEAMTEESFPIHDLTSRERNVYDLLVQKYTGPQIAEQLEISPKTVKTHRQNILKKLGFKDTIDLILNHFRKDSSAKGEG